MATFLSQTLNLIRTTAFTSSKTRCISSKARCIRRLSAQPESPLTISEAEARAVERIEEAIHSIIVKRSKPDWLPFVPGSSYWVPPRRTSYGVADVVHKLANSLTDEENLSLMTLQGWPSSAFYIHDDVPDSHVE